MIALGDAYDFGEFLYENDPESTKKESYYHYYLDLSDFAISNNLITTSNLSAWADFLTRGKTCAAKLLTGDPDDVIISEGDYNAFIEFYELMGEEFTKAEDIAHINVLLSDLELAKGKTKAQVMTIFQ